MKPARCPLCRARLAGAATCPRCGADLALPRAARDEAARCLQQALACLAAGDRQEGAEYANRALRLHRTRLGEVVAEWLTAPRGTDSSLPTRPEDTASVWTRLVTAWKTTILKRLRRKK